MCLRMCLWMILSGECEKSRQTIDNKGLVHRKVTQSYCFLEN